MGVLIESDMRLTAKLIHGDAATELLRLCPDSIHLTMTDIPYGISLDDWDVLHNNTNSALGGKSPAQASLGSGFKRRGKPINGWSKADLNRGKEYGSWCEEWAVPLLRVMKPGGSVFLFCGRRTLHRAVTAMEDSGFCVRDILAWQKSRAHHRAQSLGKLLNRRGLDDEAKEWQGWRLGNLAPYFEPIVWFFKPYRIGGTIADNVLEHGVGAMNTEECQQNGKSPGNILRFDFQPDEKGHHEAQKPIDLLAYLIRLTTKRGQLILDPFMGSGSSGVAAAKTGRMFIGIDSKVEYVNIARTRLDQIICH